MIWFPCRFLQISPSWDNPHGLDNSRSLLDLIDFISRNDFLGVVVHLIFLIFCTLSHLFFLLLLKALFCFPKQHLSFLYGLILIKGCFDIVIDWIFVKNGVIHLLRSHLIIYISKGSLVIPDHRGCRLELALSFIHFVALMPTAVATHRAFAQSCWSQVLA